MKLELPGKKVQVTCEGIIYLSEAKRIRSTRSIHSTHFTHSIHAKEPCSEVGKEPRSEVGREASATYKGAKRGDATESRKREVTRVIKYLDKKACIELQGVCILECSSRSLTVLPLTSLCW